MLAKVVEVSHNTKLGPVAATSVSQVTCPQECPWYDDGKWGSPCYANNNFIGLHTKKLNQGKGDYLDAAREEAELIMSLSGERPLRLHIVGDCKNGIAAEIVAKAVDRYRAKHAQPCWTYTRAWEQTPRECWGAVSVLASCETPRQVRKAVRKGYATAIVVSEFQRPTAYMTGGIKIVPCPQETGRVPSCTACQLCWKDDLLRKAKISIGFQAHGFQAGKVRQILQQIHASDEAAGG
jgi:hypothetical protein